MLRGAAAITLLPMVLVGPSLRAADSYRESRLRAGVRLFRSLLAADLDIADKTGKDGKLLLLFAYTRDRSAAERLARQALRRGATIRTLPVRVGVIACQALDDYQGVVPAGIFLAEPPASNVLAAAVRYGIRQQRITYSPFAGHVEKGVLGGLAVEARVQPHINMATLRASGVKVKPMFMQVAKVHE